MLWMGVIESAIKMWLLILDHQPLKALLLHKNTHAGSTDGWSDWQNTTYQ
jgi:hypothetical protein